MQRAKNLCPLLSFRVSYHATADSSCQDRLLTDLQTYWIIAFERGERREEIGERRQERGERREETGERKEERERRGKRREKRGKRREKRGERREKSGERREEAFLLPSQFLGNSLFPSSCTQFRPRGSGTKREVDIQK